MRVYIAAPWRDKAIMPDIASKFLNAGHVVTHAWWKTEDIPENERTVEALRKQAQWDVEGVKAADLVVVLNSSKSEGKSVEQGIAIADKKPILAVGKRGEHSANVFHYLINYKWVDSVDEALKVLDTIQWCINGSESK